MGLHSPFFFAVCASSPGITSPGAGPNNWKRILARESISLQSVVEGCLQGLGYQLVDLDWQAGGCLRVFIELDPQRQALSQTDAGVLESEGPLPEDGSGIRIEDCERVSHQLSHVLAVEDIDYSRLEVSSPGLDRPLRKRADFERFLGSPVQLRLRFAVAGQRNFEGRLGRADDDRFVLEWDALPVAKAAGKGTKVSKGSKAGKAAKVRLGQAADAARVNAGDEVAGESTRRMVFALDDVERARLVPQFRL